MFIKKYISNMIKELSKYLLYDCRVLMIDQKSKLDIYGISKYL